LMYISEMEEICSLTRRILTRAARCNNPEDIRPVTQQFRIFVWDILSRPGPMQKSPW
jgi:hypothetical protein